MIRRLMQTRRDGMIPRYWRLEDYYGGDCDATGINLATSGAWTSLGANYTFWLPLDNTVVMPEDSYFKFRFTARADRINSNGWQPAHVRLYNITTATNVVTNTAFAYHQTAASGTAPMATLHVERVTSAAAGAGPWQYQWQYYVYAANVINLDYISWHVEVCRQ